MCDDLIDYFFKENEDRKMDIVSAKVFTVVIVIYCVIFIFFNTDAILVNIFLTIFGLSLIFMVLYIYIFFKVEEKIIMKKILSIKTVFKKYREFRVKVMYEKVEIFLKNNNLYSNEKIFFILDYVNKQKKGKVQRDWISLIIQVFIAIFLAFVSGNTFYYEEFIIVLAFLIIISIFIVVLYYTIFFQYRSILGNIFFKNNSIIQLEKILSDIYLSKLE